MTDSSDALQLRHRAEKRLGVPASLHDYQWEGVSFLYRSRSALLADEMGLGKTVQTSVAARASPQRAKRRRPRPDRRAGVP